MYYKINNLCILIIDLFMIIVNIKSENEINEHNDQFCGLLSVPIDFPKKCFKRVITSDEGIISNLIYENPSPRIVGSALADKYEAPWTAYIKFTYDHVFYPSYSCQGTIINKQWIITSAYCVRRDYHKNMIDVYVGNNVHNKGKKYEVIQTVKHPKSSYRECKYDLALLRLSESIEYKTEGDRYAVNSICLPSHNDRQPPKAKLFSWGQTGEHNKKENDLRKAYFDIHSLCNDGLCFCTLNTTDSMLRRCADDSGSGLVKYSGLNSRASLIGILQGQRASAAGKHLCADTNANIFFARVSKYVQWIIETL